MQFDAGTVIGGFRTEAPMWLTGADTGSGPVAHAWLDARCCLGGLHSPSVDAGCWLGLGLSSTNLGCEDTSRDDPD